MTQTFTISNKSLLFVPYYFLLHLPPAPWDAGATFFFFFFKRAHTAAFYERADRFAAAGGLIQIWQNALRWLVGARCRSEAAVWRSRGGESGRCGPDGRVGFCWFFLTFDFCRRKQNRTPPPNKVMTGLSICRICPCSWRLLNKLSDGVFAG